MLNYNEHYNDCWTERETFFRNEPEGDLIYDSCEGTTAERTAEGVRIKVTVSKRLNWMQVANRLSCELIVMSNWAFEQMRQGKRIADLEVLERTPEAESYDPDADPLLYFYSVQHWVMYENDDAYLFVFDLARDNSYLGSEDIDGLQFTPRDCLSGIYSWLKRWYDRVNGYPESR